MEKLISLLLFSSLILGQDSVLSAIREQALIKGLPEDYLTETFSSEKITIHNYGTVCVLHRLQPANKS